MAMAQRVALVLERERTEAALREVQERLAQAERLALAGQLAASIAHEINNPLAYVRSSLEAFRGHLPALAATFRAARDAGRFLATLPGETALRHARALTVAAGDGREPDDVIGELAELLAESTEGASRLGQLVASFRRLSSPEHVGAPGLHDLGEVIASCVASLSAEPGSALVRAVPEGGPCQAFIDRDLVEAALGGLLRFLVGPGIRRTKPGGVVSLRTGWKEGKPAVVITDPGLVVSDEQRRRLFDPRLEEVMTPGGRTVRLTLEAAASYRLLGECGAGISVSGQGDAGLAFSIVFPATPAPPR